MNLRLTLLVLIGLIAVVESLTIQASGPQTCIAIENEQENQKIMINYHHNLQLGTARLSIYSPNGQLLISSGDGADYKHYLELVLPQKGNYQMCFEKNDPKNLQVSFQILREEEEFTYAGKQDLGKLTRRVGEFLVQVKKSSWEYKQVLAQHNALNDKFRDYEATNYLLYGGKLLAMIGVLSVQIWFVRQIFD